jgi:hypothetical protein
MWLTLVEEYAIRAREFADEVARLAGWLITSRKGVLLQNA